VAVRRLHGELHLLRGRRGQHAQHPARPRPGAGGGLPLMMTGAGVTDGLAVTCRGGRKHFGQGGPRIEAPRGVGFDGGFGELSVLVGPSGCGKTTLIWVVAGLLDRTAGDLAVLGTSMDELAGSDRVLFRRQNLGFLFQQYNLLPALTAAENVAVPLLAAGTAR